MLLGRSRMGELVALPFEILEATAVEGTLGMSRAIHSTEALPPGLFSSTHSCKNSPCCTVVAMATGGCFPGLSLLHGPQHCFSLGCLHLLPHLQPLVQNNCVSRCPSCFLALSVLPLLLCLFEFPDHLTDSTGDSDCLVVTCYCY